MERTFKEAVMHRRTYYAISNQSPISDIAIESIIKSALMHIPSSFNSQTSRAILLLGNHHGYLWDIVKETLAKVVSEDVYKKAEEKINASFACGYGTILFFEDGSVVKSLQQTFPLYSEHFPKWSLQTSGMIQFAVWTMLEDAGLGASLQHYNPLIDAEVRRVWNIPESWTLVSQMPFGQPKQQPAEKSFQPIEQRFKVFK